MELAKQYNVRYKKPRRWKFLILLHPLSNIKITKYFTYKSTFSAAYSRHNLRRMKFGAYAINLYCKKVKKNFGFYYLMAEIQLLTLKLNLSPIFFQMF